MVVQEARSRYTLDLWLPHFNLAIEVDGPFHYGLDVELHPHQHPYAHDPPHQPPHAAYQLQAPHGALPSNAQPPTIPSSSASTEASKKNGGGTSSGIKAVKVVRGKEPLGSTVLKRKHLAQVLYNFSTTNLRFCT